MGGTCLYQEGYKPLLINCGACYGYEQVAKADCEYPIDYVVKLLVLTIGSINDRVILSEG